LGQSLGGISNSSIPNGNLIPYNVNEIEFGLDTRLFDGKLSVDVLIMTKQLRTILSM
jgi:outer membrane receptor protein involved in Fe transport